MNGSTAKVYHVPAGAARLKLVIEELSPWPVHFVGSGTYDPRHEISLIITPLDELLNPRAFRERVITAAMPAFSRAEVLGERQALSRDEWPVEVIDSQIVEGKTIVEARINVLYNMLEWSAAAIFRGRPARVAAERDRALRVLMSGRPDWSRPEIIAISQLRGDA